ncbi:hypothetical protein Leryth_026215 [Lithospermum erythrorhizon]|nr:hypothetical protein Leryth_026215 [Lithospermum erythrorhizon]
MASERSLLYREVLPFAAMVTVECALVGLNTLFKAASLKGLSYYVFILYTYALATLVLFPFALVSYRRSNLPSISYSILSKICFLGFGMLSMIFGYKGMSIVINSIFSHRQSYTCFLPSFAIIFRMEKVAIRSFTGLATIAGTIIAILGAFIVVLYKGSEVVLDNSSLESNFPYKSSLPPSDWVIGGLLLSAAYLLISLWYIVQVQTMKPYPVELVVVFLYNISATIISAPVCLIAERNLSAWKLTNKTVWTAVVYGVRYTLQTNLIFICLIFICYHLLNYLTQEFRYF